MTVSSTSSRVVYAGNGATVSFPFAFKVQAAADLVVVYTDATGADTTLSPSAYGATGFGLDAGGTVSYPLSGGPIAVGTRLTIYRDVAVTQPASISNQGAMWPAVIEQALDRLTYIAQKVADSVSRSLVVSPTDSASLNALPNTTQRANSVLGFDATGQPYAAQLGSGLAAASTWLTTNFFPTTTAASARAVLGAVASGDNTAFTGANTFAGASTFSGNTSISGGTNTFAGTHSGDGTALSGLVPPGLMAPYLGRVAPTGWLLCNGATFSRATYPALAAALIKSGTITVSIASPAAVVWTANGLWEGDPVKFTTTGALPTGLTAGTIYYVLNAGTNGFNLSATPGGAAINTSGSQSGVHTGISAPCGDGDGSTTANTPDWRGRTIIGHDTMGNAVAGRITFAASGVYGGSLGNTGGAQSHTLTSAELPIASGSTTPSTGGGAVVGIASQTATAFGLVQPGLVLPVIVKT